MPHSRDLREQIKFWQSAEKTARVLPQHPMPRLPPLTAALARRFSTARIPHPRDRFDRLHGRMDVVGFAVSAAALYYLFIGHRKGLLAAAAGAWH